MPQRTNEFQDLVALIQHALAPAGSLVTVSVMVPSPLSGALREIDILIETLVGPYSIKIAVEAKDEGRKLDATKMEAIIGKYRGRGSLLVNSVVVVSLRGFTEEAKNRARDEDFKLMTLDEAQNMDWSLLPQQFSLHYEPYPESVAFEPELPSTIDQQGLLHRSRLICNCHGHDCGPPIYWMDQVLFQEVLPNVAIMEKLREVAVARNRKVLLNIKKQLTNHRLRHNGNDYPLVAMTMSFGYIHATGPLVSKAYEMSDQQGGSSRLVHSQGSVGGHNVKLLLPETHEENRGVIKLEEVADQPNADSVDKCSWRLTSNGWIDDLNI